MTQALDDLLLLLDLEQLDQDHYRGACTGEPRPRVFGGQVAAQALMAAGRTAPGVAAHSLHAYFLRSGDPSSHIDYRVERIRDGKSFATRIVVAEQRGHAIFHMSASFHLLERGFVHQLPMPDVVPPDACLTWEQWLRPATESMRPEVAKYILRPRAIEMRPIAPMDMRNPSPAGMHQHFWLRAAGRLPDDPLLHQCIAVYGSDYTLLSAAMRPHGKTFTSRDIMAASLDHAMWLHHPFRMDEWLLYEQTSPAGAAGRGLAFGHFFAGDGRLVASVAQEGLIRPVERPSKAPT